MQLLDRRVRRALVPLAGVLLAACSSGDGGGSAAATRPRPTITTTTTAPPTAPLTGLPAEEPGNVTRPALVVKIDNAPQARPQAGLDKADAVFEEVVEGGLVRFLAVFHSRDAERVGPVRSVRPVDPDIITPLRGLFAYAGGIEQFKALIRRAPVKLVGFDELTSAYVKRRDKPAPHHLYTSTPALYEGGGGADGPPGPLFTYGPAFAPAGASPATHLTIAISGSVRADWDFDAAANVWRRGTNGTPHTVEGGGQLGFSNVIVQFVPYRNTRSRDAAGNPVPEASVIGRGEALVLSAGKAVRVNWTKGSASSVTSYTDAAGMPVVLTPGATWVTLAPTGAPVQLR